MIARRLIVIPFVIAGLWLSATPSIACTCQQWSPPELAALSEVVFTGMARTYDNSFITRTTDSAVVEFRVDTVYKGPLLPTIRVQALGARGMSALGAGCGWGLQLGRRYTIFALDHDTDGVPNTNGCLQPVEGPIVAADYGLPQGRAPTQDVEVARLAIVTAVALLAIALISVIRRPRPLSP